MKASVGTHLTRGHEHSPHMLAICAGLRRHGIDVVTYRDVPIVDADFCVAWGLRRANRIRSAGFKGPILVAEHGYLGDRINIWTSMGWDGLNGRARFPEAQDGGERFWLNHGHLASDWEQFDGYALVIGQVLGDMSLTGVDFPKWVKETIEGLERLGLDARFRPHPEAVKRGQKIPDIDPRIVGGTLAEAMAEASCIVTWNSNTGVDAVLAGIPTITTDEGAMAWPMTSHSIYEGLVTPDRTQWFRDMAWKQWTFDEIASGASWDVVRTAM